MPALWPGFQAALTAWFCGNAKGDSDEDWQAYGGPTADKIASEYETAITTAGVTAQGNMYSSGFVKATMAAGFKASFAQQFSAAGTPPEGIDIGTPVWMAAATGTVNAWAAVQYNAMPAIGHVAAVLPLTGGPTDCLQTDPGMAAISGLASDINNAFHTRNCASIAGVLVAGFTKHMAMINGQYFGLMPNPGPPPPLIPQPPVPWSGVS